MIHSLVCKPDFKGIKTKLTQNFLLFLALLIYFDILNIFLSLYTVHVSISPNMIIFFFCKSHHNFTSISEELVCLFFPVHISLHFCILPGKFAIPFPFNNNKGLLCLSVPMRLAFLLWKYLSITSVKRVVLGGCSSGCSGL